MRILVTGGAGFIGSHMVRRLLKRRDEVIVVDDLSRPGAHIILRQLKELGKFHFLKGDIRNGIYVDRLFNRFGNLDAVIHEAAQVAVTRSITNPRHDFEVNAIGTFNLLEAVRKHSKKAAFIYASTNKVYGKLDHLRVVEKPKRYAYADKTAGVDESTHLDFYSPYGCSKGIADQYVHDYHRIYGIRTLVFRQSCIYGPWQFGMEDQGWVAWFLIASVLNKPITVYGNGKQVRDLLFVDDLVDLYLAALKRMNQCAGKVYNIGGGTKNTMSILELLDECAGRASQLHHIAFAKPRQGDQLVYVSNISKARHELGWEPKIGTKDGINRLYSWVSKNRDLLSRVLS